MSGTSSPECHIKGFQLLCRICGNKTQTTKNSRKAVTTQFLCKKYEDLINTSLDLNTKCDIEGVHPVKICIKCHSSCYNIKRGSISKPETVELIKKNAHKINALWKPHNLNCPVCDHINHISSIIYIYYKHIRNTINPNQ